MMNLETASKLNLPKWEQVVGLTDLIEEIAEKILQSRHITVIDIQVSIGKNTKTPATKVPEERTTDTVRSAEETMTLGEYRAPHAFPLSITS